MVESVLAYLQDVTLVTLIQIGIFFVPGLVLAFIMHFEAGFVERRALGILGRGWYLGLFGWLGTTVHEIGHAIFCLIFRHKITDMKLFDPGSETGTLGYVEHSYNRDSIYQMAGNFFIGVGPILLGTAIIYLLAYLLLGLNPLKPADSFKILSFNLDSMSSFLQLVSSLWALSLNLLGEIFSQQHLFSWQLYLFIYLAFAIGSSITLSPPDIKSAMLGFSVILVLIFIFNLATFWAEDCTLNMVNSTAGYFSVFYAAMFLTLLLNLIAAGLFLLPLVSKRKG